MSHVTALVDRLLTGRALTATEDAALRDHVRACEACRRHYDETLGVLRLARGGGAAPAPGELARLTRRAVGLAGAGEAAPAFDWRWLLSGATAAVAVLLAALLWPRATVGEVLFAGRGVLLDGQPAAKGSVVLARAMLVTEREDTAVLLAGPHGRRGLLLRPATSLRVHDADEATLAHGRLRVQTRKAEGPFVVRADAARVEQDGAGVFVVERGERGTVVAVHQGTVRVVGRGAPLVLHEGQEAEVSLAGELTPARPASASALVEDRGTVWDAILRFLRQLLDAIAGALEGA